MSLWKLLIGTTIEVGMSIRKCRVTRNQAYLRKYMVKYVQCFQSFRLTLLSLGVWSSKSSKLQFDVEAMIIIRKRSNLMTMCIFLFKMIRKRKFENLIIPDQVMAKCGCIRCMGGLS